MSQYLKDPTARALSLLGGSVALQMKPNGPLDWVAMTREGFRVQALDSLGSNIQATTAELAQLLGVSTRMLAQRRRRGTLTQHESERLFRVARVLAHAEEVFDDLANAYHWLKSPIIVLRGATPLSLLDSEVGGEVVMDTLGRIAYGIPA